MKKTTVIILFALLSFALTACGGGNALRFDGHDDITNSFMNGTPLPGYRYYTLGPENTPDAILGIKEGYTLTVERWHEREMTPEVLKLLVMNMNDLYGSVTLVLYARYLVNDAGERVAIWYSSVGLTQAVMEGPTEVMVAPPNPALIDSNKARLKG